MGTARKGMSSKEIDFCPQKKSHPKLADKTAIFVKPLEVGQKSHETRINEQSHSNGKTGCREFMVPKRAPKTKKKYGRKIHESDRRVRPNFGRSKKNNRDAHCWRGKA